MCIRDSIFVVVVQGVKEGDKVFLHPLSDIEEAQDDVEKFLSQSTSTYSERITRNQSDRANIRGRIQ